MLPWSRSEPSVAIVTMFRNEANALCEWVSHHVSQGVKHIYMIDHNSTDSWNSTLSPKLRSYVTVVWERREKRDIYVSALRQLVLIWGSGLSYHLLCMPLTRPRVGTHTRRVCRPT